MSIETQDTWIRSLMPETCAECGAELTTGGGCLAAFHELLALEASLLGGPGERTHFLAVASYNLQHPPRFMPAVLFGLRDTMEAVVAGRASIAEARRRAREATDGSRRVLRRPDTMLSAHERAILALWPRSWRCTIHDVCRSPHAEYAARVEHWARAVVEQLDAVPHGDDPGAETSPSRRRP